MWSNPSNSRPAVSCFLRRLFLSKPLFVNPLVKIQSLMHEAVFGGVLDGIFGWIGWSHTSESSFFRRLFCRWLISLGSFWKISLSRFLQLLCGNLEVVQRQTKKSEDIEESMVVKILKWLWLKLECYFGSFGIHNGSPQAVDGIQIHSFKLNEAN